MKQILKKNQIIISVIAIMLIAAGYMNYTSNEKQALETAEIKSNEQNTETTENAVQNEINTSTTVTENSGNQYFAELRLERDKMYSQMLESYQKILSNSQISETQK